MFRYTGLYLRVNPNKYIAEMHAQELPSCPPDTQPLYEAGLAHIRASRLTDAELIYTPSQIALAAFSLAAPDLALQWSTRRQSTGDPTDLSESALSEILEQIRTAIVSDGQPPDVEVVREVDRRLRLCKNPEKVAGTQAYEAKRLEEEKRAEEKRQKKVAQATQDSANADPFGDNADGKPGLVDYDDEDED
jgi:cyclin H